MEIWKSNSLLEGSHFYKEKTNENSPRKELKQMLVTCGIYFNYMHGFWVCIVEHPMWAM